MQIIKYNEDLSLSKVDLILFGREDIKISSDSYDVMQKSYEFLSRFLEDKIIYGVNTGFGPMAQHKIDSDKIVDLQYNLIRSHSSGKGEKLPDIYVRAAMLVRLKSILQGKSGIHPSCAKLLEFFINNEIYPVIPRKGGVGASGDLVQLAHLALSLIGEGEVSYKGKIQKTSSVFKRLDIKPISVNLREGLALINGTSVMTGIGLINVIKAKKLLNWSIVGSSMLNEIVESFDDHFSKELNSGKKHQGQQYIADTISKILKDSSLITKRENYFYHKNGEKIFKRKVQEYYSLRCLPQILGPIYETVLNAEKVCVDEANSVSDNPLIDIENKNVYHGGNFHGDYISLEMDKLKIALTKLSLLSERQLAFLLNPKINEILPPFVNLGTLGLNMGMQGAQFTATSCAAENQTLSNPMSVHSITTNNDNQDVVSMGTNSALLTKKIIDNSFGILAIEFLSISQAIDYLNISKKLSNFTELIYSNIRELVPVFKKDSPKNKDIQKIENYLENKELNLP